MTNLSANASNARSSSCLDIAGAIDVDVELLSDGVVIAAGEVTLAPRQYDNRLAAYGPSPDH